MLSCVSRIPRLFPELCLSGCRVPSQSLVLTGLPNIWEQGMVVVRTPLAHFPPKPSPPPIRQAVEIFRYCRSHPRSSRRLSSAPYTYQTTTRLRTSRTQYRSVRPGKWERRAAPHRIALHHTVTSPWLGRYAPLVHRHGWPLPRRRRLRVAESDLARQRPPWLRLRRQAEEEHRRHG